MSRPNVRFVLDYANLDYETLTDNLKKDKLDNVVEFIQKTNVPISEYVEEKDTRATITVHTKDGNPRLYLSSSGKQHMHVILAIRVEFTEDGIVCHGSTLPQKVKEEPKTFRKLTDAVEFSLVVFRKVNNHLSNH